MSGISGIFSSLGRLFSSGLDPERKRGADPGIRDIFSSGLLEPAVNPQRAAGTSILEAAGAGPPTPFLKDELDRAIETGAVEPVTSLPTEFEGVLIRGQERLMKVFDKIKPILSGRAKTPLYIFKAVPQVPPNTPDISLGDPDPPGFSSLSLEDFLERVRRKHGVGI